MTRTEEFNKARMEVFDLAATIVKRPWHVREQNRYPFHPTVRKVLETYQPLDWHLVLLEWSHVATDGERLAFTRNEKKGEADLQEVTSVGKYLKRHFPQISDHHLRDFAALKFGTQVEFHRTTKSMVQALMQGPTSCMTTGKKIDGHPYNAYCPDYGWHLAVRLVDGSIQARALCNENTFVRTYGKDSNGHTQADGELEAHLQSLGYSEKCGWAPGTKLARIETGCGDAGFLAPYLDGENQNVYCHQNYLTIADGSDGDYALTSTNGTADCTDDDDCDMQTCENCDDRQHYEDMTSVGQYEDCSVCSYCLGEHYTLVRGRLQSQYYLHDKYAVNATDGNAYDGDYLSDNDIIKLENGDCVKRDDAFCCAVYDEWYHVDEGINTEDNGMCYEENTWLCSASGNYYSDHEEHVIVDGEKVHPDCVEESETPPPPAAETPAELVTRMQLAHAKLYPIAA